MVSGQLASQCHSHFAGFQALQVGVGERGVLLRHRAEALDGVHQVLLVHVLKQPGGWVRTVLVSPRPWPWRWKPSPEIPRSESTTSHAHLGATLVQNARHLRSAFCHPASA